MGPAPREGDRSRWYMLQPYLIALLMSKGIPMLWQGQELAENYFLPEFGAGRVSLLRPLRWDYFYDGAGRSIIALVIPSHYGRIWTNT
jgi:maltooligosyltrehalose trehalohydrolase